MVVIYGTIGPDTRNGTPENDTIYGWAGDGNGNSVSGDDNLYGQAGDDNLYGGTGNDELDGGGGNDYINGGIGNDKLAGGAGDDIYVVGSTSDIISENPNEGTDSVNSYVNWTLGSNLENLTLQGSRKIKGIGNALDNTITGNAANDSLDGQAGSDTLYGLGGDDTLNGGSGVDYFYGGLGNDTYIVDNSSDVIYDDYDDITGIDTVRSLVTWQLDGESGDYYDENTDLENLILTGSDPINGTGNLLNNLIVGNVADNELFGFFGDDTLRGGSGNDSLKGWEGIDMLYGEAGDDTLQGRLVGTGHVGAKKLYGGQGNDTYYLESTGDTITEDLNEGIDTVVVYATSWVLGDNLENLESSTGFGTENGTGNSLNNTITGGGANSNLNGGIGNDTLVGGFGLDTLTGGAGADHFVFNALDQGIDTITDFSVSIVGETIDVSAAGFGGGLTAGTPITAAQFKLGTAASDASDRFIYDKNTGALFFDADGTGRTGQVQFATLSTNLVMTNAHISVIG